jgi:hypothetical protein
MERWLHVIGLFARECPAFAVTEQLQRNGLHDLQTGKGDELPGHLELG